MKVSVEKLTKRLKERRDVLQKAIAAEERLYRKNVQRWLVEAPRAVQTQATSFALSCEKADLDAIIAGKEKAPVIGDDNHYKNALEAPTWPHVTSSGGYQRMTNSQGLAKVEEALKHLELAAEDSISTHSGVLKDVTDLL